MRILLIHARRFRYRAVKKALRTAEELGEVPGEAEARNALVAYISVERQDAASPREVAEKAAEEILDVYRRVGAEAIVVYPYAHLSSSLAQPGDAAGILRMVEEHLGERGYRVLRAPFGWYKEFELECYGHPLSELSRTVSVEGGGSRPRYYAYSPGEELVGPLGEQGIPVAGGEGIARRAAEFCAKFGLDPSNPMLAGSRVLAMMELARRRVEEIMLGLASGAELVDAGCVEEACPRCASPGIQAVPARLKRNPPILVRMVMRGGECWREGVAAPARAVALILGPESTGEAANLLSEALSRVLGELLPWISREDLVAIVDAGEEALREGGVEGILEALGIRGVVRVWGSGCGGAVALEAYWARDGQLLSSALSALLVPRRRGVLELYVRAPRSLEDLVYAYMARAAAAEAGGSTPTLPLWLSPVHVRVLPVSSRNTRYAEKIASMLRDAGLRVEIDSSGGLGKRIRRAGADWVPYIVVIGSREEETGTINVRIRSDNKQISMRPEELIRLALEEMGGAIA